MSAPPTTDVAGEASRPSSTPSIAVVIPVRDARALLPACLSSITTQLRGVDQLIVVDDGSMDGSDQVAADSGATVLRQDHNGPYAARNAGWRATDRDIVVFTDARCRARDGWLDTVRDACADDGVALVCSDIEVVDGDTPAAKIMHARRAFHTCHTNGDRFFLPYFGAGNLAVRRAALEAVGGFVEVRSGGDADLCWRIQLAGLGEFVAVERVTMDWIPRPDSAGLIRQWARYGRSQAHLHTKYAAHGLPARRPGMWRRIDNTMRVIGVDLIRHRLPLRVAALDALATWVHGTSLASELRRIERADRVSGGRYPA